MSLLHVSIWMKSTKNPAQWRLCRCGGVFIHGLWRGNNSWQQNQNAFKIFWHRDAERNIYIASVYSQFTQQPAVNLKFWQCNWFLREKKNSCKEEILCECEICYGISSIISPFILIPPAATPTAQGSSQTIPETNPCLVQFSHQMHLLAAVRTPTRSTGRTKDAKAHFLAVKLEKNCFWS